MRFHEIQTLEANIAANGLAHLEKQPFEIPVSGDDGLNLIGMICHRKDGRASYYYQEEIDKERIVLHFTAGHLRGDLITLMGELHVSVPYVVARDGTIYQLFDPSFWSYHLGPDALGGNKSQSSRTIGIELSNYGPLLKNGDQLETVYSSVAKRDIYCNYEDTEQYLNVSEPFREHRYFANFTDAQYDSLIMLLRHLTNEYDIPREFLQIEDRYKTSNSVLTHQGIVSHVNYRSSGKWDIGPAFDWDRVILGVQASAFRPLTPLEHRINRKRKEIEAEKEILKKQRSKIEILKDELAALEHEFSHPVQRDRFIHERIITQDHANDIFHNDLPVTQDNGEENIEPGYSLLQISESPI